MKHWHSICATMALALAQPAAAKNPVVGAPAPQFTINLLDKTKVKSEELIGKVVVLNFWATWCGPCRAEMPMMHDYFVRNRDKGLAIYGILSEDSAPPYQLKKLREVLAYPLARNASGKLQILRAVPTNFVIDRKGVLRYAKPGSLSAADFKALVDPLLAETP